MSETLNRRKVFIAFSILMILLGISDSLRGLFVNTFQMHYGLNNTQSSMIITVSYLGNLVFLMAGGQMFDRFNKKRIFILYICLWLIGLILFSFTDNYIWLLVGMFIVMGSSTVLSTNINVMTPLLFAASPGLLVNLLFFIQGIGISFSQKGIGQTISGIGTWNHLNMVLLAIGLLPLIIMSRAYIPEYRVENKKTLDIRALFNGKVFTFLVFIFGTYFIMEHGIMNWLYIYIVQVRQMSQDKASLYLALFYGGITLGRLLFAPIVERLKPKKSILCFSILGVMLYLLGSLGGSSLLFALSLSGLALSIVYPTLVLLIQEFYAYEIVSSVTGAVISVATLFDIGFNAIFGLLSDFIGMEKSFYSLCLGAVCYLALVIIFIRGIDKKKEARLE